MILNQQKILHKMADSESGLKIKRFPLLNNDNADCDSFAKSRIFNSNLSENTHKLGKPHAVNSGGSHVKKFIYR